MSAKNLTAEYLAGIADRIVDAPAPARSLTSAEALQRLLPTLRKMRSAGHTPDSIFALLQTEGLQISARAVARALRTGKTSRRASGKAK